MKPNTSLLLLILTSVSGTNFAEPNASWSILSVGDGDLFYGGEVPMRPGTGWLALTRIKDKHWSLLPATLTARKERHPIWDGDTGEPTGIKMSTSNLSALVFLKHGSLRAGRIPSVQVAEDEPPRLNIPIDGHEPSLKYLGKNYRLSTKTIIKNSPTTPGGYVFVVEVGDRKITLSTEYFRDDDRLDIRWAGDLNHDGILDFVTETSWHNGSFTCWYLSRGKRVVSYKKIGCHYVSGC